MQAGIVNVLPTASSDLISMWPLSYSVALNSKECFEYLTDVYSDIYSSKKQDYYLLAAKYNALEIIKIINTSIQVDKTILNKKSVSFAFKFNSPDVFVWLLDQGVNHEIILVDSERDKLKLSEFLLNAGLKNNNEELMLEALSMGMLDDEKMIECYLNFGVESDYKLLLLENISNKNLTINGKNLYQVCIEVDDIEFLLKLKELDFNLICPNQVESIYATLCRISPISICRSDQAFEGYDLNLLDEDGKGLIHYCIENSTLELLDLLLKRGWLIPI